MILLRILCYLCNLGILLVPGVACAAESALLGIEANEVRPQAGPNVCLITLTNRLALLPLSEVRLFVVSALGTFSTTAPFGLAGSQSSTVEWILPPGVRCTGEDVLFRAKFKKEGIPNEIVLKPELDDKTRPVRYRDHLQCTWCRVQHSCGGNWGGSRALAYGGQRAYERKNLIADETHRVGRTCNPRFSCTVE